MSPISANLGYFFLQHHGIAQPKRTCWWWRVFLQPWPLPAGAAHWQTCWLQYCCMPVLIMASTYSDWKGCLLHTQCLVHCLWLPCLLSSAPKVLAPLVFTPLGWIVWLAVVSLRSLCCSEAAQNAIWQPGSNLQVGGVFDFPSCSAQCTCILV